MYVYFTIGAKQLNQFWSTRAAPYRWQLVNIVYWSRRLGALGLVSWSTEKEYIEVENRRLALLLVHQFLNRVQCGMSRSPPYPQLQRLYSNSLSLSTLLVLYYQRQYNTVFNTTPRHSRMARSSISRIYIKNKIDELRFKET